MVEGEKCADAARACLARTWWLPRLVAGPRPGKNPNGYPLAGREVILVADGDPLNKLRGYPPGMRP